MASPRFALLLVSGLLACADDVQPGSGGASPAPPSVPPVSPPGATPGVPVAAAANAVLLEDDTLHALERTAPQGVRLAFRRVGPLVEVRDDRGVLVRSFDLAPAAGEELGLFGGFDLDADGLVDFGVVRSLPTGSTCGATPVLTTRIELRSSASGAVFFTTEPATDLCWTFPGTTYPTRQWSGLGVLFGATAGRLAVMPYYATSGRVLSLDGGDELTPPAITAEATFAFPSVPAYDAYPAAKVNAHGGPTKYEPNSHVANGLFLKVGAEERLLFFTSARLVQYTADGSTLVYDHPYLSGGRLDMLGRNYGVVAVDPAAPEQIVLVSGTPVRSLHADQIAGTLGTDPWGGIERHVSRYDAAKPLLLDRFYSFAHDNGDGNQYQGRISFPDQPFVPTGAGPSRVIYGEYTGGHWYTHVSTPDSLADALVVRGLVPWDVRDVDGDGTVEIIASPSELPGDPDVPGWYFTRWQTRLLHWNEATRELETVAELEGIPELVTSFRATAITSSASFRYPVAVVDVDGEPHLVLRGADGSRSLAGGL